MRNASIHFGSVATGFTALPATFPSPPSIVSTVSDRPEAAVGERLLCRR
jgi:hypothetical protein